MVIGALLSLFVLGCGSPDRSRSPEPTRRIGTYHGPSLVVAWVRSPQHASELQALVAARDAAAKAGDAAKVAECERRGAESQDLAHRQLAGEVGTQDVIERVKDELPEVRRRARVERIVAEGEVRADDAELVDVTDLLVELFHPDAATREVIAQVRKLPKGERVH